MKRDRRQNFFYKIKGRGEGEFEQKETKATKKKPGGGTEASEWICLLCGKVGGGDDVENGGGKIAYAGIGVVCGGLDERNSGLGVGPKVSECGQNEDAPIYVRNRVCGNQGRNYDFRRCVKPSK